VESAYHHVEHRFPIPSKVVSYLTPVVRATRAAPEDQLLGRS